MAVGMGKMESRMNRDRKRKKDGRTDIIGSCELMRILIIGVIQIFVWFINSLDAASPDESIGQIDLVDDW